MDPELIKLCMELQDLSLAQRNDLWSMLKVAVTPAVLYRVKMVTFRDAPLTEAPKITEVQQEMGAR